MLISFHLKVYHINRVKLLIEIVSKGIKPTLLGEWFIFVNPAWDGTYAFSITRIKGTDFISFVLDDIEFKGCI